MKLIAMVSSVHESNYVNFRRELADETGCEPVDVCVTPMPAAITEGRVFVHLRCADAHFTEAKVRALVSKTKDFFQGIEKEAFVTTELFQLA